MVKYEFNSVDEPKKFKVRYLGKDVVIGNKKLCKNDVCYAEIQKYEEEIGMFTLNKLYFSIIVGGFRVLVNRLHKENDYKLPKEFEIVDDSEIPNGSYVDKKEDKINE